jgi:hypothetical protein
VLPKPPIDIVRRDPFHTPLVLHFADLMTRYGAPIIVLNLVKTMEKTPRESKLRTEFGAAVLDVNRSMPASVKRCVRARA